MTASANAHALATARTRLGRAAHLPAVLLAELPVPLVTHRLGALTASTGAAVALDDALGRAGVDDVTTAAEPGSDRAGGDGTDVRGHRRRRRSPTVRTRRSADPWAAPTSDAGISAGTRLPPAEQATTRRLQAIGDRTRHERVGDEYPAPRRDRRTSPLIGLGAGPQGHQQPVRIAPDPELAHVISELAAGSAHRRAPLPSVAGSPSTPPMHWPTIEPDGAHIAGPLHETRRTATTTPEPGGVDDHRPAARQPSPTGLAGLVTWWDERASAPAAPSDLSDEAALYGAATSAGVAARTANVAPLADPPTVDVIDGAGGRDDPALTADPLAAFRDALEHVLLDEALADGVRVS